MLHDVEKEKVVIGSILNDTSLLKNFSFRKGDFTKEL